MKIRYLLSMSYFNYLYENGLKVVCDKKVVFCGMVRDCAKELNHNITTIEKIGSYFSDYRIVIFENNSKDDTKLVLTRWMSNNKRVNAIVNDFDETKYQQIPKDPSYYLPNCRRRIQKYVDYRNMYMEYLDQMDFESDYTVILDMDVDRIDVKGFITSFGNKLEWDVITANGYSTSPKLKRRYHDTYALCEFGNENGKQSVDDIIAYRDIFSKLKKGMPFIRVFSAYGGLAIYKSSSLLNARYSIIYNNYKGIEVRCEHYSLYKVLAERGFDKVYINPNMEIHYQKISQKLLLKKIKGLYDGYK